MVSCHGELCQLVGNHEINEISLLRKFISETKPVIEKPESDDHPPVARSLSQRHGHFVVPVSDFRFLSPDRLPSFVKFALAHVRYLEPVEKSAVVQPDAEMALGNDRFSLIFEGINRRSAFRQSEIQLDIP